MLGISYHSNDKPKKRKKKAEKDAIHFTTGYIYSESLRNI